MTDLTSWDIWTASARGQKASFSDLTKSSSQLLIVDPSTLDGIQPQLSKAVAQVRHNGAHRLVGAVELASISPSDSEWSADWVSKSGGTLTASAPSWLTKDKTDGAYRVQYWAPAWQAIVIQRVHTLMAAGFDGVAPSGLDGYSSAADHPTAAVDMVELVAKVSQEARSKSPNALVIPLDGAGLIDAVDDKHRPDLVASIDGMVGTGVFYGGPKPSDNDLAPQPDLIAALDKLDRADKRVLVVEHLNDAAKVTDFEARARSRGYLPDTIGDVAATPTPPVPAGKTAVWTTPADGPPAGQTPASPAPSQPASPDSGATTPRTI